MPKFYKPSEVAGLLNYNKVTIIRWIHAGKIKAIKIGRERAIKTRSSFKDSKNSSRRLRVIETNSNNRP